MCTHLRASYDTHDMCVACRRKEGCPKCMRDDKCHFRLGWSDIECSVYECNLRKKEQRKQKKLHKIQRDSVSSEDSMAMDPAEEFEDMVAEESGVESVSVKSLVTKVPAKRISVQ